MNRKQRLVDTGPFQALAGRVRSEPYRSTILMAVDSSEASRRSRSFNVRSEGDERPAASTAPASRTRTRTKPRNGTNGGMALRGKENATNALVSPSRGRTKGSADRVDLCAASSLESPAVVMDEDSNDIYPVGQFFGNVDVLPDYPERTRTIMTASRREHRRRHYYAKEDEDDETTH